MKKNFAVYVAVVLSVFVFGCGKGNQSINTVSMLDSISKAADKSANAKTYRIESIQTPVNAKEEYKKIVYRYGKRADSPKSDEVMAGTAWGEKIEIPVDWSCKAVTSRKNCFRINGLQFLDSLFIDYENTDDQTTGRRIMEYIIDWARQNQEYTEANKKSWQWHDDATALRVLRMSFYYTELGGKYCSEEERNIIKASLKKQADLLMTEKFYTKHHNHGMHQDTALLAYAFMVETDEKEKKIIIEKALGRTGEYIDYVFTSDGIHKEHSPFYARDVLRDCTMLLNLTERISPDFYKAIKMKTDKAFDYLTHITKPDGTFPPIGDSSALKGFSIDTEKQPQGGSMITDIVYPEGGYAIFRSSWEKDADWMMFMAATHSSTHKHGDDLSFLVYHKGDLFVEAGNRNYNYRDIQTAWAYSGFAHNVLIVNDKPFPVKIGSNGFQSIYPRAKRTGIVEYDINSEIKKVTGRQFRFENVDQRRTLRYDKKRNVITVTDDLKAKEDLNATLLYHIADGVTVQEVQNGWAFYRGGVLIANMVVESKDHLILETITGKEGTYPYCTWIFNGKNHPVIGSLLLVKLKCSPGKHQINATITLK